MRGRDRGASKTEKEFGTRRCKELTDLTARFMIRRTIADVPADILPTKTDLTVFCRPADLQRDLMQVGAEMVMSMDWLLPIE
jgi:SNF2 family DNA or RNA helicase